MEKPRNSPRGRGPEKKKSSAHTSWGPVAKWYDDLLEGGKDSYQEKVILPNLMRILDIKKEERILDIACGQGFFARAYKKAGAVVEGADVATELVIIAKKHSEGIPFYVAPAHKLEFAKNEDYDAATIILSIQNMEGIADVLAEAKRVLRPGGRLILVVNHPAFRVPKRSRWGFDEHEKTQYRRVDRYLSGEKVSIVMNPGKEKSVTTYSYHRSLQDFFKALSKSGFSVSRLEEWISHKKSQGGPRQEAEDAARREIPLFLMLEAKKR